MTDLDKNMKAGEFLVTHACEQLPEIVAKMLIDGLLSSETLTDIGHGMNLRVTLTMEEQL